MTAKSGKPFLQFVMNPTPLIYAILCEQVDTVLYLITRLRASLEVKMNGWYPIHFAAAVGNYEVLFNIFRIEGTENEVNKMCDDGSSPLHIAVGNNQLKNTLILLVEGCDPNAQDGKGNTPLHLCARVKNMVIAKALLSMNAKLGVPNFTKETPLSICKMYKNNDAAKYIEDVSTKKVKRASLQSVLRRELPELADDDDEDEEEEISDTHVGLQDQEVFMIKQMYKKLGAVQKKAQKLEKRQILSNESVPSSTQIEVPETINTALVQMCRDAEALRDRVNSVATSLGVEEIEKPQEEVDQPLLKEFDLVPINLFPRDRLCTKCGSHAAIMCNDCKELFCRICHYSCLHTCKKAGK